MDWAGKGPKCAAVSSQLMQQGLDLMQWPPFCAGFGQAEDNDHVGPLSNWRLQKGDGIYIYKGR